MVIKNQRGMSSKREATENDEDHIIFKCKGRNGRVIERRDSVLPDTEMMVSLMKFHPLHLHPLHVPVFDVLSHLNFLPLFSIL